MVGVPVDEKYTYFYEAKDKFDWKVTMTNSKFLLKTPDGFEYECRYYPEMIYVAWAVFHEGGEPKDVIPW
jgi:hypothetical protein